MPQERKPGDVFLDRYMPDATEADREAARANLYAYFGVLLRIATRRAEEDWEKGIRPKGFAAVESDGGANPLPL